jgi:magnesium chelatase family protein
VGPPGAGKTLLAERFPDILPPLERDEALEVARIRSAAGIAVHGLPTVRPLRSPYCGASAAGILGGGNPPRPGDASLAHRGVLFLDELPQFHGDVLDGLRQPLESGEISVSRAAGHLTFPSRFQLLAAMNP